jgi:Myb-like DNA-binding domain
VNVKAIDFTEIACMLDSQRTGKQCRDRWKNFLRSGIKKGAWTDDEEELIKDLYATFGPKYATCRIGLLALSFLFPFFSDIASISSL